LLRRCRRVVYEAQIILQRDNPQELMADFVAVSQFIEERKRIPTGRPARTPRGDDRLLHAVKSR
jgi:hypothetical protein